MRRILPLLLALSGLVAVTASAQTAPTCVQAASGKAPAATLTFTAPTQNTDGTAIATPLSYTLYQGTASGQETKVATALTGSPIHLTTGLQDATTYYWYLTVTDAKGQTSAPSNEACMAFPPGVPMTVTITVQ